MLEGTCARAWIDGFTAWNPEMKNNRNGETVFSGASIEWLAASKDTEDLAFHKVGSSNLHTLWEPRETERIFLVFLLVPRQLFDPSATRLSFQPSVFLSQLAAYSGIWSPNSEPLLYCREDACHTVSVPSLLCPGPGVLTHKLIT